jgi:hypothetical protein
MSGSNSSAHDEAGSPEPLSFTVHSMPQPDLDAAARRTASGRLKMLLVLAVCAAPVIASYLTYYVIRPGGRTNYATLIQPSRALPDIVLTALDGRTLPARSLAGQWLLLVVSGRDCAAACEKQLYMQRQLREMMGKDRDRVDKVWLLTGEGLPQAALLAAVQAPPAVQVLRAPREALAAWLAPEAGHALEDHLYIVDPMGEWMMRAPADADPVKLKRDLEKLMRGSAGWDKPGR